MFWNVPGKKHDYYIEGDLTRMEKKVTVVMSAYNHGQYVEKAIQSVLNQTYQDFYFVVADDASTDCTADILRKYEGEIDEIHLYYENSGHGRCRDMVLNVKTKYVALINSDDYWELTKLEKQVNYMEQNPECAACFTWCNELTEKGELLEKQVFQVDNRTKEEWMYLFWQQGNCLAHPSILIKTEIYQELFVPNNSVFRQLPDYNMWLKLIQRYNIHVIDEKLVNFLYHKSEISENVSRPSLENSIRNEMEIGFIWYKTMKEMDDAYFRKAFAKVMVNPKAISHKEILCEKYFVLCISPLLEVRNAAISYYYDIFSDEGVYMVLKDKYGYCNKDFHKQDVHMGYGKKLFESFDIEQRASQTMQEVRKLLEIKGVI